MADAPAVIVFVVHSDVVVVNYFEILDQRCKVTGLSVNGLWLRVAVRVVKREHNVSRGELTPTVVELDARSELKVQEH